MKAFLSLLACAAVATAQTTQCHADNCARSVTGTANKPALTSKRADCSSFFQITVTPDPSITVVWQTITPFTVSPVTVTETTIISTTTEYSVVTTTTTFVNAQPQRRQEGGNLVGRAVTESPSLVPSYASWCSGTSRYSSACSCWGVTKVTIEVATPTVTVTSTYSATATITPTVTESDTTTTVAPATSVVVSSCPAPFYAVCSGSCKHTRYDPENCGSCGNVCASGNCVNGVCSSTSESCPSTYNCQSAGNFYPACSGRPGYPVFPSCLCFQTYDGLRFCTDSTSRLCTSVPQCTTHDDCELGSICVVNGCCYGGNRYCRPVGLAFCAEPNAPSRLFKLRRKRLDVDISSNIFDGATELGYIGEKPKVD